ncbi:MAG: thioredoxin domain-containing protein, partial [Chloroflexota bacterium]
VTPDDFAEGVLRAERPTLVDFFAAWCAPCKMMEPLLEDLAAKAAGKLDVVTLDVQAHEALAVKLGVMNLPTLILYVGGEEKVRLAGALPPAAILQKLEPYL